MKEIPIKLQKVVENNSKEVAEFVKIAATIEAVEAIYCVGLKQLDDEFLQLVTVLNNRVQIKKDRSTYITFDNYRSTNNDIISSYKRDDLSDDKSIVLDKLINATSIGWLSKDEKPDGGNFQYVLDRINPYENIARPNFSLWELPIWLLRVDNLIHAQIVFDRNNELQKAKDRLIWPNEYIDDSLDMEVVKRTLKM